MSIRSAVTLPREERPLGASPGTDSGVAPKFSPFGIIFSVGAFAATRLIDAVMLRAAAAQQQALAPGSKPGYFVAESTPAHPGYLELITNWDGQWYESIGRHGYPTLTGGGSLVDAQQAWAFPPGFPLLTRAVMGLGLPFSVAATLLNLLCGAAAMALLFAIIERRSGRFAAATTVAATCCFITAPLLQMAYSESLAMLLLMLAFSALTRRSYGWATLAVLALSLVRIVTPPFAAVVAVHWLARHRARPISRRDSAFLAALCLCSLGGGGLWTAISRLLSGHASLATARTAGPFAGKNWFVQSYGLLGWPGFAFVCLLALFPVLLARRPAVQAWDVELRTWLWSYPIYVLAVTPITTGVLRYLLFCFPIGTALAGAPHTDGARRSRVLLIGLCCLMGIVLQGWWITHSFVVHPGSFMP